MSNWISSKLKVAETFFEQIDQQAADSLKKNERERHREDYPLSGIAKSSGGGPVSLKDQLKKKTSDAISDGIGRSSSSNSDTGLGIRYGNGSSRDSFGVRSPPRTKTTLSDSDWTELLSNPGKKSSQKSNAASGIRLLRKVGNGKMVDPKNGSAPSLKSRDEMKFSKKVAVTPVSNADEKICIEESVESGRFSNVDRPSIEDPSDIEIIDTEKVKSIDNAVKGSALDPKSYPVVAKASEDEIDKRKEFERRKEVDGKSENRKIPDGVRDSLESAKIAVSPIAENLRSSLTSDEESDSDSSSNSSSSSDSESELSRRKTLLAEKAAARALEVIKERENIVARLEGEKLSLEKRLEEQAKQQVQEASELQTTMIETIEAAELEKMKHNSTRKEALIRLSKLEIANANQARVLSTMQKDLESEAKQITALQQQIDQKESALRELTMISNKHKRDGSNGDMIARRGFEVEREILEAEYSFLTEKIVDLEEKATKLEENIEVIKKEMEEPSEVEVELKRRLNMLTDHLIQKQAQVESLSSEKATLGMKTERLSRLLEESKSTQNSKDLESGIWGATNFTVRPMIEQRIIAGRDHIGSLVKQLDSLFTTAAALVRRNSHLKLSCLFYFICLHLWVAYILMAHSPHPALS